MKKEKASRGEKERKNIAGIKQQWAERVRDPRRGGGGGKDQYARSNKRRIYRHKAIM